MSLVGDIAQAYRTPRKVMQMQIDRGISEPQTLFYGIFFGAMNLIANYPRVAGNAPDQDVLAGMMAGLFIAYIFFLPLMLYGFAGGLHWMILKFGGQASWAEARRALNWSAVVTIPFILISGSSYVLENNILPTFFNVVTAIIFLWQLWSNVNQAEFH